MDRRQVLRMGSALGVSLALGPHRLRAQPMSSPPPAKSKNAARYHVLIMMSGGVDNVFTVDPKRSVDVEKSIDVPYAPNKIVQRGGLALGPHYADLADQAGLLAVVNGVRTGTASHIAGAQAFLRLKEAAPIKMPSILDLLAHKRDGQPLASVSLGALFAHEYTSDYFGVPDAYLGGSGTDLFTALEMLSPDELKVTSETFAGHARALAASGDNAAAASARAVSQLCQRLPTVKPLPARADTTGNVSLGSVGGSATLNALQAVMDRALWVIENDLAAGLFLHLAQSGKADWDSHLINEAIQSDLNVAFAKVLARFLQDLGKRSNAHGTLLAQTQIVAGSELGRYPRLNDGAGKDHFPQTSFIFAGSNSASAAAFGATGREMEGVKVSLTDGKKSDVGAHLRMGDIGASLLWRAGIDPEPFGYHGNILRYLWS